MYASASDVATHLGRTLSAAETDQVTMWIGWLEAEIDAKVTMPDPNVAQRAVVESIAAYMSNPTGASTVTVAVDDASMTRRYSSGVGGVRLLSDFWYLLGVGGRGAFTVTPYGAPDAGAADDWS